MVKRINIYTLLLAIFISNCLVFAQPELKTCILKDLRLESGVVMQECKVTYRLFGRLNDAKSNAVLFPTWFAGNSAHLAGLVGAGKIIDSSKYFVIAVDALGDGFSSSPSNTQLQQGSTFPEITIHDMVVSQYRMITEGLGLTHLHGIVGGSMGSMQVFEWVVSYPDFMNKAVPYVCTPKLTSFDLLWMHWAKDLIAKGRACSRTDKEIWQDLNIITAMLGRTPEHIVESVKTDTFMNYFKSFYRDPSPTFTIDNYLAQLQAMIHHDIFRNDNGSMEAVAKKIKANVLMIFSEEDHLIRAENSIAFCKVFPCKTYIINNKMGHMCIGKDMQRVSKEIDDFLGAE